jgi:hypothetical protein
MKTRNQAIYAPNRIYVENFTGGRNEGQDMEIVFYEFFIYLFTLFSAFCLALTQVFAGVGVDHDLKNLTENH